jgi:hypothetical protein
MLITLQPWLRGEEPKVRTVDTQYIVSIERQGTRVEITTANSQIFIERFPNDEEATRRYDELILKWAQSSPTATLTELSAPVDTKWIKLGAYYFKSTDIKYIKQFPSGIRVATNDGDETDIIDISQDDLEQALLF